MHSPNFSPELTLTRGSGYVGTFAKVVAYTMDDLLDDGAPVMVRVSPEGSPAITGHAHDRVGGADALTVVDEVGNAHVFALSTLESVQIG